MQCIQAVDFRLTCMILPGFLIAYQYRVGSMCRLSTWLHSVHFCKDMLKRKEGYASIWRTNKGVALLSQENLFSCLFVGCGKLFAIKACFLPWWYFNGKWGIFVPFECAVEHALSLSAFVCTHKSIMWITRCDVTLFPRTYLQDQPFSHLSVFFICKSLLSRQLEKLPSQVT